MNGAQAARFEALFCNWLKVFPVGFALSLLVFHNRRQKPSPERGKTAAKNHQEKDRSGLA